MTSMLERLYQHVFSSSPPNEELEEPEDVSPSDILINIDGTQEFIGNNDITEYIKLLQAKVPSETYTQVGDVLFDTFRVQPAEYYNEEASLRAGMDIYGPAVFVLCAPRKVRKPKKKSVPVRRSTRKRKARQIYQ